MTTPPPLLNSASPGLQVAAGESRPMRLPSGPVLGWSSFAGTKSTALPCVSGLPNSMLTSSGRASLYLALRQLDLPPGSQVLVPSYHCPTMVAPVVCAGLVPVFFAIDAQGLPMLDSITAAQKGDARAMIVAHYFGLPKSLKDVRAWCSRAGIALIEDCAHSLFGRAGELPVGAWGDFATASISKFLPVPELGLLASANRRIEIGAQEAAPLRSQLKGVVDVLESACVFGRPAGISTLLQALFGFKNRLRKTHGGASEATPSAEDMMRICDMARIDQTPLLLSRWLFRALPLARVVERRQSNYDLFATQLQGLPGTRFIAESRPSDAAPYVFPLWVQAAERTYLAMRAKGLPVFRWDRIWPGTPDDAHDEGPRWSRHVLQLLCHQDLSSDDVRQVATELRNTLHH
ncbi:DegT/DnrJ/EryC1/StrS family aminotransferase [Aquabacterium sp.]|uniref:DegT/DnrJ/EryC1/StrS family aminotransferase n=1 Tax=Aquabacterium sp. TaxID=1872578 RepID=UPI002CD6FF97|nr:DegT/DnrJ/EryC1/StrS family aminotransferase [Aquabacterium sp.]HSW06813.1 DegT/DnrJ/EryC1/StrS family aminotransferase [Aquabacterium sp.]